MDNCPKNNACHQMFTFLEGHKIKDLKPGDMLSNIKYFGTRTTQMVQIFTDQ